VIEHGKHNIMMNVTIVVKKDVPKPLHGALYTVKMHSLVSKAKVNFREGIIRKVG